jgi:hypothetical protein
MAADKRREMEEYIKNIRRDMDSRLAVLEKDIVYMSELVKYLNSVSIN